MDSTRISSSQLGTLIIGFVLGSAVILSPGLNAGSASWLTVVTGVVLASPIIAVIIKLNSDYPGKTLVEINDLVLGPIGGKLFSLLYLWYFFHLGALVLNDVADFISNIMPTTPYPVFLVVTAAIVIYLSRNGIEVMARCSSVIILYSYLAIIIVSILMFNNLDLANFLPINSISMRDFLKASYEVTVFPFGDIIVFTMLIGFINNSNKIRRSIITALIISTIFGTLFNALVVAGLGNNIELAIYPGYNMVRRIDIYSIITRVDIIGASANLTLGILKTSVTLYAVSLGVAQMFKLSTSAPLVLPIGTLMIVMSLIQFDSVIHNLIFHEKTYIYYAPFFQAFLPLITLLIHLLKRHLPSKKSRSIA